MNEDRNSQRLLILASKLGYQTRTFAEAAARLGVEVTFGTDRCERLEDPWRDGAIALHFERPEEAAEHLFAKLGERTPAGLLVIGDRPLVAAAHLARRLDLAWNPPEAVENCRSKLRQREVLAAAGLPVPGFFSLRAEEDPAAALPRIKFPCVVKPLALAASRGVVRADNEEEFLRAARRVRNLLESPEVRALHEPESNRLLVEDYIPGVEVAVEGLLDRGRLRVLAIFDKPDPLEGPYFEETIYVTPSRLPEKTQQEVRECCARSVRALGLVHGPLHAEFRINARGTWVLEIAPRPIGGLCSRALRFGPQRIFLEELLVRHALGFAGRDWPREPDASGVMMIPVPRSGILERVEGLEDAAAVPAVCDVQITARLHDYIAAWPEGSSYLGFLFARAASPAEVERALRQAHAKLRFVLTPRLPVEHPATGRVHEAG